MKGNGDSDLDLDLLVSAWSFWFCPWSCWFATANLKRSFTRKEKPKKRKKRKEKRKKLKQNKQSHSLDRENDCAGGQKELLTYNKNGWFFNRFFYPTQIFLWKPYSSKIVLYFKLCKIFSQKNHFDLIETRPKHGLCSCNKSAAYSYQFNNVCRTINSSQEKIVKLQLGKHGNIQN